MATARMPARDKCRATLSAPCLVRVKTIARLIALSWMTCVSSAGLLRFSTK